MTASGSPTTMRNFLATMDPCHTLAKAILVEDIQQGERSTPAGGELLAPSLRALRSEATRILLGESAEICWSQLLPSGSLRLS